VAHLVCKFYKTPPLELTRSAAMSATNSHAVCADDELKEETAGLKGMSHVLDIYHDTTLMCPTSRIPKPAGRVKSVS